jgi:hypothetical protein
MLSDHWDIYALVSSMGLAESGRSGATDAFSMRSSWRSVAGVSLTPCFTSRTRAPKCEGAVPEADGRQWRPLLDEPVRQRLGQCPHGELLLVTQDRAAQGKICRSRDGARADVFDDTERLYNAVRRHSTLGYVSPVEFKWKVGLAQLRVHEAGSRSACRFETTACRSPSKLIRRPPKADGTFVRLNV